MDMRMDKRQATTAFDVVNGFSEKKLHEIFEKYGEVTNARSLAKKIVQVRGQVSLKTISAFTHAIRDMVKGNPNRYFAQVFQALRIEVNDEFGALRDLLIEGSSILRPGGRFVIISFHSLEDRIVKHFFKTGSFEPIPESEPFKTSNIQSTLKPITKKPLLPSEEEVRRNPRSRSAKLRVAEKLG